MTRDQKIAAFNEAISQHKHGAASWWAASLGPEYQKQAHEAAEKWAQRIHDSLTPAMRSELKARLR